MTDCASRFRRGSLAWPVVFLLFLRVCAPIDAYAQENAPYASLGGIQPVSPEPESPNAQRLGTPTPSPAEPHVARQALQRRIGQIFVQGNDVTKNRVVRQYLDLAPGDVADLSRLRTSQQNLISTRLFEVDFDNGVFPRVEFAPSNDPYSEFQDILVTVQETQTSSLLFGADVNSDLGVRGKLIYHERNFDLFGFPWSAADLPYAFRGAGQEFRVEVMPGTREHKYLVSFREPRLLGLAVGIGGSGYYFRRSFSAYDEQRLGGRIIGNYRVSPTVGADLTLRIENVEISDPQDPTLPDLVEVLGDNFLFGVKLALNHDTRDSHIRPTEGHRVEASIEQVVGTFDFPKAVVSGEQHWTLYERPNASGRHVLTAGGQIGYTGSQTPIYERFYAGGLQTIRGFQFRGVSPVSQDVEVGGDFLLLANLQYQFPFTADDRWLGVIFVDSGTVERDFEILDYRVAVGAGLRVQLPFTGPAPIAVDIAFPVSDKDTDDRQIVSFFVGFSP